MGFSLAFPQLLTHSPKNVQFQRQQRDEDIESASGIRDEVPVQMHEHHDVPYQPYQEAVASRTPISRVISVTG